MNTNSIKLICNIIVLLYCTLGSCTFSNPKFEIINNCVTTNSRYSIERLKIIDEFYTEVIYITLKKGFKGNSEICLDRIPDDYLIENKINPSKFNKILFHEGNIYTIINYGGDRGIFTENAIYENGKLRVFESDQKK